MSDQWQEEERIIKMFFLLLPFTLALIVLIFLGLKKVLGKIPIVTVAIAIPIAIVIFCICSIIAQRK